MSSSTPVQQPLDDPTDTRPSRARPNTALKVLLRGALLLAVSAVIAGLASTRGISTNLGYLQAGILSGAPGGRYNELATRLARRAAREHGRLDAVATAGSIDNVARLTSPDNDCRNQFAFIQDGTPVPNDSGIEILGRLPNPESLLFLGRRSQQLSDFDQLRGASIGIGPKGSGTAHLMEQLAKDPDLTDLQLKLVNAGLDEQAQMVADGRLALATMVSQEDAPIVGELLRKYDLELFSPAYLEGLVGRYPWMSLGRIPAGHFNVLRRSPATDKTVAQINTFVVANDCARRAERVAVLGLLESEVPGFARANPPRETSPETAIALAPEARQFYQTGGPELADRYFPWLVNLMSPAYWVYLAMAVTVLFNAMKSYSRFRLWRIDAAREKLKKDFEDHLTAPDRVQAVTAVLSGLAALKRRCQRQTGSFITPMGDEMFYRYQESLIDHLASDVRRAAPAPTVA